MVFEGEREKDDGERKEGNKRQFCHQKETKKEGKYSSAGVACG